MGRYFVVDEEKKQIFFCGNNKLIKANLWNLKQI